MTIFCKHDWKITVITYAEPVASNRFETDHCDVSATLAQIHRLRSGVTTVLQECTRCHSVRKHEMLGKLLVDKRPDTK